MNYKVASQKGPFYHCIYSHKNYAYGKRYDDKKENRAELINLEDKIDIPIYLSGMESIDQYKNDIVKIDFDSSDSIEIGINQFKNEKIKDLNSINPIYIDYNNVI